MPLPYSLLLIFTTGLLGIWKAVPLGILLNVHPVFIFSMSALGSIVGVLILFFFGNKIRDYILHKRAGNNKSSKKNRATKLFEQYGAAGLGFLGCLLFGPNMTIILGLLVVKSQKKLLYWTLTGIVVWSIVLTLLGVFSVEFFSKLVAWTN